MRRLTSYTSCKINLCGFWKKIEQISLSTYVLFDNVCQCTQQRSDSTSQCCSRYALHRYRRWDTDSNCSNLSLLRTSRYQTLYATTLFAFIYFFMKHFQKILDQNYQSEVVEQHFTLIVYEYIDHEWQQYKSSYLDSQDRSSQDSRCFPFCMQYGT